MAIKNASASFQLLDADGSSKACDVPFKYDDATATLASIATWIQGLGVAIDSVTDGQITKIRISLLIPLPGGIKASPNANSVNERTGLITFSASGTPNAYGVDVPGFLPSLFAGDALPSAGAVATLESYLTTVSGTIVATDRYGNALVARKRGKKTFRE